MDATIFYGIEGKCNDDNTYYFVTGVLNRLKELSGKNQPLIGMAINLAMFKTIKDFTYIIHMYVPSSTANPQHFLSHPQTNTKCTQRVS